MAHLRTGKYGNYYGSYFDESEALTQNDMEVNATYIYNSLHSKGWSTNAIAALLGNMQAESSINSGRWQSDDIGNAALGYGLVQWTPATKYIEWCSENQLSDASEMDNNISRIIYEVANGLQWITTDSYPISFSEFTTSQDSVTTLTEAFLINYERPADQSETVKMIRAMLANAWYTYITNVTPTPPVTTKKKKGYNFLLFKKKVRFRTR